MQNKLYEFTIKVSRGDGCDMPENMEGAYVNCYASAPSYEQAMKKGVMAITKDNYVFEDVVKGVREIPVEEWSDYIEKTWPEFVDHLPSQEEVKTCVDEGMVFFSPFMGFNSRH